MRHTIRNALPAIEDALLSEIDNDSEPAVKKVKVGVNLRCKNRIILLGSLALDNHFIFDKHIKTIRFSDFHSLVNYRHKPLRLDLESANQQFMSQGVLIVRFEQSWSAKFVVDSNRRIQNHLAIVLARDNWGISQASASLSSAA